MEREEEDDVSETSPPVGRAEQFTGRGEKKRAEVVSPDPHSAHISSSAGSVTSAEGLSIQTSASWDTVHNVTHSSVVTSGYDSSASTDVSFSSPFLSPEQESTPFFGGEGAQGSSLGWGQEYYSPQNFQGEGGGYFLGGYSGDMSAWQQTAGGSMQASSYPFHDPAIMFSSMSTPPSAMLDMTYGANVGMLQGTSQPEDTNAMNAFQSQSGDVWVDDDDDEISEENEVSIYDSDFDIRDLSSASLGVSVKTGPDSGRDDDSAAWRTVVDPSSLGGPGTAEPLDTREPKPNVFVDREEEFILPGDLPQKARLVASHHMLVANRKSVTVTSQTVATPQNVELYGENAAGYAETDKLSSYSTSVKMSRGDAISSSVGDSGMLPGTGGHTEMTATSPAVSVHAEFTKPAATHSLASQSMDDHQTNKNVTVEEVLEHISDEGIDDGCEVPGSEKTEQVMDIDTPKTTDSQEQHFSSGSPHRSSKTKYTAHFTVSSAPDEDRHPQSESPSVANSNEQRYLSTLYIASGQPRNAHTRPEETEDNGDYLAKDSPDSAAAATGSCSFSSMSFLTKPCAATFDVGRLRSPTPIRLTGGQWGQVSQVITPLAKEDGPASGEIIIRQTASGAEIVAVREGRDEESMASIDALVVQAEECRDSSLTVDTAGGDPTNTALYETGIAGDGSEGRGDISAADGGNISLHTASHHVSRLFSPEDEQQGKVCYYSHISDDDEDEEEDEEGRAVSYLSISVSGYNRRSDFIEHKSTHRIYKTGGEQKSETSTTLVQGDTSPTSKERVKSESYWETEHDSEDNIVTEKDDSTQLDKPVVRKEPERHTQHLNVLFNYSDVSCLEQEESIDRVCPADSTVKYSVVEFSIKSKPKTVAVHFGSLVATANVSEMEQADEETVAESGESALHIIETEDIGDESLSVTTTIDHVQDSEVTQFAAHLDDSKQKLYHPEVKKEVEDWELMLGDDDEEEEEEDVDDEQEQEDDKSTNYSSELVTKELTAGEGETLSGDGQTLYTSSAKDISGVIVSKGDTEWSENTLTEDISVGQTYYVDREEEFVQLFCRPMLKREQISASIPVDQVKPAVVDVEKETQTKDADDYAITTNDVDEQTVGDSKGKTSSFASSDLLTVEKTAEDGKTLSKDMETTDTSTVSAKYISSATTVTEEETDRGQKSTLTVFTSESQSSQYVEREEEFVNLYCRPMLRRDELAAFLLVDQVKPAAVEIEQETRTKDIDDSAVTVEATAGKEDDEEAEDSSKDKTTSYASDLVTKTMTAGKDTTLSTDIKAVDTATISTKEISGVVVTKDVVAVGQNTFTEETTSADQFRQYVGGEEEFVNLYCRPMLKREHMAESFLVDQVKPAVVDSGKETKSKEAEDRRALLLKEDNKTDEDKGAEDRSKGRAATDTSQLSVVGASTTTTTVETQQSTETTTTITAGSTLQEKIEQVDKKTKEEEEMDDEETDDEKDSEEYDVELEEKAVFGKKDMAEVEEEDEEDEREEEEKGAGIDEGDERLKRESENQTDGLEAEDTTTYGPQTDMAVKEMGAGADATMQTTDDDQIVLADVGNSDVVTEISSEDQVSRGYSDDFESDDDDKIDGLDAKPGDQPPSSDQRTEILTTTSMTGGITANEEAVGVLPQGPYSMLQVTDELDDDEDDVLAELDAVTKSMGDLDVQEEQEVSSDQITGDGGAGYPSAEEAGGVQTTALAGGDGVGAVYVDRREETVADLKRPTVFRLPVWGSSSAETPQQTPEKEEEEETEEEERGAVRYLSQETQQGYELRVQKLLIRMEQSKVTLTQISVLPTFSNFDLQLDRYEVAIQDLQSLQKEIYQVVEELEGCKGDKGDGQEERERREAWVQTLLTPVVELRTSLETLLAVKGDELQRAAVQKSERENGQTTYMHDVCQVQAWVTEVQGHLQVISSTLLEFETTVFLKQLLEKNKGLQAEATAKLKLLSDLESQCTQLCLLESPEEAEKLTPHLSTLTLEVQTIQLRLSEEEKVLTSTIEEEEDEEMLEEEEKGKTEEEEERWSSEEEIGRGVTPSEEEEEEEKEKERTGEQQEGKEKDKQEERDRKTEEDKTATVVEEKKIREKKDETSKDKEREEKNIDREKEQEEEEDLADDDEEEEEEEEEEKGDEPTKPQTDQQRTETQTAPKEALKETDHTQRTISASDITDTHRTTDATSSTPESGKTSSTPESGKTSSTPESGKTSSTPESGKTVDYSLHRATEASADTTTETPQQRTLERTSDSKTDTAENVTVRNTEEKVTEEGGTQVVPRGMGEEESVPETVPEGSYEFGSVETEQAVMVLPDFGDTAWRTVTVTDFDPSSVTLAEQKELQLSRATDLKEHQKLLQHLSTLQIGPQAAHQGAHLHPSPHQRPPPPPPSSLQPAVVVVELTGPCEEEALPGSSGECVVRTLSAEVVQIQWEKVQQLVVEETAALDQLLLRRQAGELVTVNTSIIFTRTQLLVDIGSALSELSEASQKIPLQTDNKQVLLTSIVFMQYQMLRVVRVVTMWLTTAQKILLVHPHSPKDVDDHLRQIENLQRELQQVQGHITLLTNQTESLSSTAPPECADTQRLAQGSLTSLQEWVSSLELEAVRQHGTLQQDQKEWQQYQSDVAEMRCRLLILRSLVKSGTTPSVSAEGITSLETDIASWDTELRWCETRLTTLTQRELQFTIQYPGAIGEDARLLLVRNLYVEVQRQVAEQRTALAQIQSCKKQYEHMLEELGGFLRVGETKLADTDQMTVLNPADLQSQLNVHKKFFSDLEDHRAALDTAAFLCDAATREEHRARHAQLCCLAQELGERARQQTQRLESLLLQWSQFQTTGSNLQAALLQVEEELKKMREGGKLSVGNQKNRIQSITKLQKRLQQQQQQLSQVLDQGRQMQKSITYPDVERMLTDLEKKWASLDQQLQVELQTTEALTGQLQTFQAEGKTFKTWLKAARKRLEDSLQHPKHKGRKGKEPEAQRVRSQTQAVLDLRKEMVNQEPLKARVVSSGRALMGHPQCSGKEAGQELAQRLKALEEEWTQLETSITAAEKQVEGAQVQQVPAQERLAELQQFVGVLDKALQRDAGTPLAAASDVQVLLKKCKVYRMELDSKQPSMDTVRGSLQETDPGHSPLPQDMKKYADSVVQLDQHWTMVCARVDNRLRHLDTLSGQWSALDRAMSEAHQRLTQQEKQLTSCRHPDPSLAAVLRALQDCRAAQNQLHKHLPDDIQHAQTLSEDVQRLMDHHPDSQQDPTGKQQQQQQQLKQQHPHTIQHTLNSMGDHLEQLVQEEAEVEKTLEELLGHWRHYEDLLLRLGLRMTQVRCTLDGCSVVGPDLDALAGQVERLKTLQQDLKTHDKDLNILTTHAAILSKLHGGDPARSNVQSAVSDLQTTWNTLTKDLTERLRILENCLGMWKDSEARFVEVEVMVKKKEEECKALIRQRADVSSGAEDSLKKCEALQNDLNKLQGKVTTLKHLDQNLTGHMRKSTITHLTSRHTALEHRLQTLQQQLSEHVQDLQKDASQFREFQEASASLLKVLECASKILSVEDPQPDVEVTRLQGRLEALRQLLVKFQDHTDQLNNLNDLGHRMTLPPGDSSRLQDLNRDWHQRQADCQGRCRVLQGRLLAGQTFSALCQRWQEVLTAAQALLQSPMAGDLPGLLEQQKLCQSFEKELPNHQQTLHTLVTQGQKMMESGQTKNPAELQQNLQALTQQWQNTVTHIQQRKAILDNLVQNWQTFQSVADHLRVWLEEKEEYLAELVTDRLSLQQMLNLGERVKMIQGEYKEQEQNRQKMHGLAVTVASQAEGSAASDASRTTEQVKALWEQVYIKTVEQNERLLEVEGQWSKSEELIAALLRLMKEQRALMTAGLPETYEDMSDALNRLKEFSTTVLQPTQQLQELTATEASLKNLLQDDDQEVLHQRVLMVSKLWDELLNLSELRMRQLKTSLLRWTSLKGRVDELNVWIEGMEKKMDEEADDLESEDLLRVLQTEYAEVMTSKGKEMEKVTSEGQHLVTLCDDVRGADIRQQLQKLQDRWRALQNSLEARRQKAQSTVESLATLDRNLKEVNLWMSDLEHQLNTPIVYHHYSMQELQALLAHSQGLQEDIQARRTVVESVHQLCEKLLNDPEACSTNAEVTTLLEAQKTTMERWTRLSDQAAGRTAQIKETERQWEAFQSAWEDFSDWLSEMEREVDEAQNRMPAAVTKEDIHKYETLQKNLHDRLKDLESLNHQHHHLLQEGRTDLQGTLAEMIQQTNGRWDGLQQKMTVMLEDLRRSADAYEDFMSTQRSVVMWLREVDEQVTDVEHLAEKDLEDRLKEVQRLEQELVSGGDRLDNVKEGGAMAVQLMSREGGERVQQAVKEMDDLYRQVTEHAQSCRLHLLSLSTAAVEEEEEEEEEEQKPPPQSSQSQADMSTTTTTLLPPDTPPYTRRAGGTTLPQATVTPIPRSPSQELASSGDTTLTTEQEEVGVAPKDLGVKVDVLLEQLAEAISEANLSLDEAERLLQNFASSGGVLGGPESRCVLECKRKVDRVHHLHRLLKTEADTAVFPAVDQQVQDVADRWEKLQSQASEANLRIPKRQQSVSKFSADVDALLGWVEEAEALQDSYYPLPSDLVQLKALIRQHRDFMAQLEEKRPRYLSIQLLSSNYIDPTTPEGRDLQARVQELERRWEAVSNRAEETQQSLQAALLQCQEFHHNLHDYLLWLEGMEGRVRQCEPVDLDDEVSVLQAKYDKLKIIYQELEEKQPAVLALKETVDQILAKNETTEMVAARDKMYVISSRLQALLKKTAGYLQSLEARLAVKSSSAAMREGRVPPMLHPPPYSRRRSPFSYLRQLLFGGEPLSVSTDETDSAKVLSATEAAPCTAVTPLATGRSFWRRVLWAALPLQLLLLLLLGIACLLPLCEEDDRCLLLNNFRHSLYPMLHYGQGTPPM